MFIYGNTNYDFDSIKKALEEGKMTLNSNLLILYLYKRNDSPSANMLKKRGKEIQNKLQLIDLFTVFSEEMYLAWGKKYFGYPVVKKDFEEKFYNNTELAFERVEMIGNEYEVTKYPAIVLINTDRENSFYKLCIDYSKIEGFKGLDVDKESDLLYKYFFKPFIEKVSEYYDDNAMFDSMKRKLDKAFTGVYNSVNNSIKFSEKLTNDDDYNLNSFIKDRLNIFNRKHHDSVSKKDLALKTIGISLSSFNKRFSEFRGFNRDELISIAIFLELGVDETNDLIEMCNKAFSKHIALLTRENDRDSFIIGIIEEKNSKSYSMISSELSRNNFNPLEFINKQ